MVATVLRDYGVEHPAPHRARISNALLFTAVLAAPCAWALQLVINYGLASMSCYSRDPTMQAPAVGWNWLLPVLYSVNFLALAVALAGLLLSLYVWRTTNEEAHGGHGHLIHAGEGRTRFLAVWGIWGSVWFLIMIFFNTVALMGVSSCAV